MFAKMKWPWVSRTAFEIVCLENARAESARNDAVNLSTSIARERDTLGNSNRQLLEEVDALKTALRGLDFIIAESARKDTIIDRLMEHHVRIERRAHGLAEIEPQRKVQEPMPAWAVDHVNDWAQGPVRDAVRDGLENDYATLGSWDAVGRMRGLIGATEEEDEDGE